MSDTDKVVAAILAAGMCYGKKHKHVKYLETYYEFIKLIKAREETNEEPIKEPPKKPNYKRALEGVKRGGRI